MRESVNNEALFSGPVLITIVGDQEAGRQYEQEARALLADVLTTNGVNERIAAGDPGGFYFGTRFTKDGTRIVAETNNGLNSIDIFPSVIQQLDVVRKRVVEEEEELLPCARAGVRYYEVGTDLRDPQDAVNFVGTFPNVVQPDPETFFGQDTRYPWRDQYTGVSYPGTVYNGPEYAGVNGNIFRFGTGVTSLNPCWYIGPGALESGGIGFAYDCSFGTISVSLPASPGTVYTPEHTIQLVAAGKFGLSFKDSAENTRIKIINNDRDFSVSSNLTFPATGLAEIGWPMMIPTATKKTQLPIRIIKNGEVFGAPPFELDQKDIEYETSPDTYTGARTPPPTAFRFSRDLFNEDDAMDWSDRRSVFFSDQDEATHVTQYGKWKIDNGQIKSIPYDEDKDAEAATWSIVGEDEFASYVPAMLAHDLALDCIVGIALRTNTDGDAFIFFVVDTESDVAEDVATLDINLADFLPGEELELRPGLVKSMLAGEGVAVVSFGSTFEEKTIGASRIAVIEYCDPNDKGTINTVQITKDYVDGALVNTARLPIQK